MRKKALTPRDITRLQGVSRVTWVGLWLNLALCVFKTGAGYLANSRALLADGIHSISDLITDILILVGVRFWIAPPDSDHPYGHQRLESLITLFIGVLLGIAGIGIALEAIDRMGEPATERVGSVLALVVALASVVSKEILFRWTLVNGKELHSEAVEANAWSHRSDAIASLPIVFTLAITLLFPQWAVLDLWGALLVSAFIMHATWQICAPALNVLLDKGAPSELCAQIIAIAREVPGVLNVHALRTRYMGRALQLDMHVCVSGKLTVTEGNYIAHALEDFLCSDAVAARLGVEIYDVLPHIDPHENPHTLGDCGTQEVR